MLRRRALERDLQRLVALVARAERSSGAKRVCTYGIGADGVISLEVPGGYDDEVRALREKHGDAFVVRTSEWVVLVDWGDGGFYDARRAADAALIERGVDLSLVEPDDLRIDVGSYRGKDQPAAPYFRVLVLERVLS